MWLGMNLEGEFFRGCIAELTIFVCAPPRSACEIELLIRGEWTQKPKEVLEYPGAVQRNELLVIPG